MKQIINYKHFFLPLLIAACSVFFLRTYFIPQLQLILAVLIAPFVFRTKERFVFSGRYFYVAIIFFTAYYFSGMKLFLFLGLGCFLFYSIESRFGKIGGLPFIFLLSISPALHYVVTVFTFTLRLALSHYAADLLNGLGYPVTCNGNYFTLPNGFTFNVDKACLGLNLFNTGLALTTLLVGLAEKKTTRSLPFFHLCGVFVIACCLLIVTNFLRILVIVFFRSLPGTLSHELIGIFSLLAYMAVPVYFMVNYLVKRFGRKEVIHETAAFSFSRNRFIFPVLGFALVFFSFKSVEEHAKTVVKDHKLEQLQLAGFSKLKKQDGVMEFRKNELLVYIKPAVKGFESDHPPALCWKGSGFDVEQVEEVAVGNTTVLMATIKRGSTLQYTAWWYDNGLVKTTDQWVWRLSKGEPFRIVNLTCADKKSLERECKVFLGKRLF